MGAAALVTLSLGEDATLAQTFETFRRYARKWRLEMVVIDQPKVNWRLRWRHPRFRWAYEKLQVRDVLGSYERVIFVDADILIQASAPDLLSLTPPEALGVVRDDVGPGAWKRQEEMVREGRRCGWLGPLDRPYFNSGVLVVSRAQAHLFDYKKLAMVGGRWPDQTFLNVHAARLGIPLHWLPRGCNGLPHASPDWETDDEQRRGNHLIHYAGRPAKALIERDRWWVEAGWGARD